MYKVRKELADPSGDVCPVAFGQCQDTTIREFEYYRCESRIIHCQVMPSCSRAQSAVHEVIWCKWYFMKKGKVRTTVVPSKTTTEWFEITNKTGNALGLFFSGEIKFEQDKKKVNRKNGGLLFLDSSDVPPPHVMNTNFPASLMILRVGVVVSEGHAIRLNAAGYIKVLQTVQNPFLTFYANWMVYVFQQDPLHLLINWGHPTFDSDQSAWPDRAKHVAT